MIASVPEPSSEGKVPLQAVVAGVLAYVERSTSRPAGSITARLRR